MYKKSIFPMTEIIASEDGKLPDEIQIIPIGEWDTVPYGKLKITADDLNEMVDNFGVRAGVPIDVDHNGGAAAGWIESLKVKQDGLYGGVTWSDHGKRLLGERQYRFFSPEFNPEYTDPENKSLKLSNVLIAGSLVNRPLFKELKPLVASDQTSNKNLTGGKTGVMLFIETMNKKDLANKKYGEMNAEEKAYCNEHDADFTAEEKTAMGFPAAKKDDKEEETKKASETVETTKAKEDMVSISAAEYTTLKANADRAIEAAEKLEAKEVEETVTSWMFSEKGGHFQPALKEDVKTFYKGLNTDQRKTFSELVDKMPTQKALFNEQGSAENLNKGAVAVALTIAANELVAEEKKAGKTLKFSEAVTRIVKERPELANYELIPVEGKVQVTK